MRIRHTPRTEWLRVEGLGLRAILICPALNTQLLTLNLYKYLAEESNPVLQIRSLTYSSITRRKLPVQESNLV